MEGVREAAIAGVGLAIASDWMVSRELASGVLRKVLSEWRLTPVDLWAVLPAGRMTSAKTRAFLTWFEARIRA
jgi:DNA-binding transcriptional LysR family regulator